VPLDPQSGFRRRIQEQLQGVAVSVGQGRKQERAVAGAGDVDDFERFMRGLMGDGLSDDE